MHLIAPRVLDVTHFTLCCGIGGLSLGLSRGTATVSSALGDVTARMRCIGGVDVDPAVVEDFGRLTGARGTVLDLFDVEDFRAYHSMCRTSAKRCPACCNTGEPGPDWREATPADLLAATGGEYPDILAWSPPCKGFSGLNAGQKEGARALRYLALNRLVLRSLALALDAFSSDPPALVLMENVPLIATSGRWLLEAVRGLLEAHGYAVAETTHDCGELGGLGQHRRRFLMVGRHRAKVAPFLYEPPRKRVRAIGEVIGELPMPDAAEAGPMHRLPAITWATWVRLALIAAGKDWRCLNDLVVVDGNLRDYGLLPVNANWYPGILGVRPWDAPAVTITGHATPTTGAFSVADPRAPRDLGTFEVYGVTAWDETSGTVTGKAGPGSGHFNVADPRLGRTAFSNIYRVVRWTEPSVSVTSAKEVAIADPRPTWNKPAAGAWANSGHYGVLAWKEPAGAVVGNARLDKGPFSVADVRLPAPGDRPSPAPLIVALDGTWHRPLTTLELAALQGFPVLDLMGHPLVLGGNNDSHWRMRIGNAVPVLAAEAIGSVMADVLLRQHLGVSFSLSTAPIWVRPLAAALSMDLPA